MDELVIDREVIIDCSRAIFLTNGNTLLENKRQGAAQTRLQQLTVMQLCIITVLALKCSGGAWLSVTYLCFRSSWASIQAVTYYAWNFQQAYCYH